MRQSLTRERYHAEHGNEEKGYDELEEKFLRWETDDELQQMKRNMGK